MKIARIKDVKMPTRGTSRSAGLDFYTPNNMLQTELSPGEGANIPSGIKVRIPAGFALIVANKSGIALNKGLQVGACIIDEDYQGEVHLHVVNISGSATVINPGEKLVQMLLVPVSYEDAEEVSPEELWAEPEIIVSERGEGGFGSTGLQ